MYRIKDHKDEIITNLISNMFWYILTLFIANILLWIPLIKGIYQMINNNNYRIPIYAYILAFISIGIMTIILVIATILNIKICRKNERSRVNNIIETNLIFENLEVELYFKDRENILSFL